MVLVSEYVNGIVWTTLFSVSLRDTERNNLSANFRLVARCQHGIPGQPVRVNVVRDFELEHETALEEVALVSQRILNLARLTASPLPRGSSGALGGSVRP